MSQASKIIEIIVNADGSSIVQTRGFSGDECRDASRFIERSLGQKHSEKLTAEFYQAADVRQANQQRQ